MKRIGKSLQIFLMAVYADRAASRKTKARKPVSFNILSL
jgi:hypothetical protein